MTLATADEIVTRKLGEKGIRKVVSDMLRNYNKTLTSAWERESNEAIEESIDAFLDAPSNIIGYKTMLEVLATKLKGITNPEEVRRLTVLTDGLYRVTKEAEATKLGTTFKMTPTDTGVVRGLSREGPYWIGDFYETHLSLRIQEVGYNVTVEGGFGREAAGRTMKDVLREEFRLRGGPSSFESTIPARFSGNVDNYSRIVSSNVAQRARVYSSIAAMSDAGFKRYQFVAVMDERTSEVCQEMNERVFTVARAVETLRAVAVAETPEEFIESHPWPKDAEQIRTIAGTGSLEEQSRNLESQNISLPPLHGLCRSSVEAID